MPEIRRALSAFRGYHCPGLTQFQTKYSFKGWLFEELRKCVPDLENDGSNSTFVPIVFSYKIY